MIGLVTRKGKSSYGCYHEKRTVCVGTRIETTASECDIHTVRIKLRWMRDVGWGRI